LALAEMGRVWDDGCGLWCVGGASEKTKMTVLQFQQLMLVPFGAIFQDGEKNPRLTFLSILKIPRGASILER
jgi:hypothetical protein